MLPILLRQQSMCPCGPWLQQKQQKIPSLKLYICVYIKRIQQDMWSNSFCCIDFLL
jgi:hypothetical protein